MGCNLTLVGAANSGQIKQGGAMKQGGEIWHWPVRLILVKSNKVVQLNRLWNLTIVARANSGEIKQGGAMKQGGAI
jgi:hypothetical protein